MKRRLLFIFSFLSLGFTACTGGPKGNGSGYGFISVTALENTPANFSLIPSGYPDTSANNVQVISSPTHGTFKALDAVTGQYAPNSNFVGMDNFQYSYQAGAITRLVQVNFLTVGYGQNRLLSVTSGDTLVVLVMSYFLPSSPPPASLTVSDTAGNHFIAAAGPVTIPDSNFTDGTMIAAYLFYATNSPAVSFESGGDTVTIDGSTAWSTGWNNSSPGITVFQLSGAGIGAPEFVATNSGYGDILRTSTVPASQLNEFLFAVGLSDAPYTGSNLPISAGPNFTPLSYDLRNGGGVSTEGGFPSATGGQTATFIGSTPANWATVFVGFKLSN